MAGLFSLIARFNLVKYIPIFSKLNWLELRKIARKSVIEEYRKGEVIRREGDPPDYFYCLLSGRVQSYNTRAASTKANVDFIHRGMHFGVVSVMTGEPHSSTYEAINDSVLLKIPKEDFHSILKSIPQLGIEISQSLSKRVRSQIQGVKATSESSIISVYSPTKGTGSSTYAVNLALGLNKETKRKVILVNIQTKENQEQKVDALSSEISQKLEENTYELKEIINDNGKVLQSVIKNDTSIDLLNVVFDAADLSIKRQISPLVSSLVDDYQYIMLDLPNNMDDVVLETLTQSDEIHLVSWDRTKDLDSIRNVIDSLEQTFKERFQAERIHVIVRPSEEQAYLSNEQISKAIDFNVYTVLPSVNANELTLDPTFKGLPIYRSAPNIPYTKTITRIAREIGGVMVGLVLGGGAALGVAHIGVIRVLEENNIPIDMVVGSSMGALIASVWVSGKDSYGLEKCAREFESPKAMSQLFSLANPFKALVGGYAIRKWLTKHLGQTAFYDAKIPTKIVAYDLIRREEIVIENGSLVDAVQRSIAIPGVILPVIEGEKVIIDGGVLNPLPTNVLVKAGIRKIIAINVLQSPSDTSAGFDLIQKRTFEKANLPFNKHPFKFIGFRLGRFFGHFFTPNIADIIVRTLQATEYVIAEQSAKQADVLIKPDLVGINWFELYRVDDLIQRGEEATRKALPKIKKLIELS